MTDTADSRLLTIIIIHPSFFIYIVYIISHKNA